MTSSGIFLHHSRPQTHLYVQPRSLWAAILNILL